LGKFCLLLFYYQALFFLSCFFNLPTCYPPSHQLRHLRRFLSVTVGARIVGGFLASLVNWWDWQIMTAVLLLDRFRHSSLLGELSAVLPHTSMHMQKSGMDRLDVEEISAHPNLQTSFYILMIRGVLAMLAGGVLLISHTDPFFQMAGRMGSRN
jgi:hypothetical protein